MQIADTGRVKLPTFIHRDLGIPSFGSYGLGLFSVKLSASMVLEYHTL